MPVNIKLAVAGTACGTSPAPGEVAHASFAIVPEVNPEFFTGMLVLVSIPTPLWPITSLTAVDEAGQGGLGMECLFVSSVCLLSNAY